MVLLLQGQRQNAVCSGVHVGEEGDVGAVFGRPWSLNSQATQAVLVAVLDETFASGGAFMVEHDDPGRDLTNRSTSTWSLYGLLSMPPRSSSQDFQWDE